MVYEYKNDCLIAGVKYKKSYYQDRDLKPKEDLLFSITFFHFQHLNRKSINNYIEINTMKVKIIFVYTIILLLSNQANLLAIENKILFKIENKIITSIDIFNEINYLKIINKDIEKLGEEKIFQIAKLSY